MAVSRVALVFHEFFCCWLGTTVFMVLTEIVGLLIHGHEIFSSRVCASAIHPRRKTTIQNTKYSLVPVSQRWKSGALRCSHARWWWCFWGAHSTTTAMAPWSTFTSAHRQLRLSRKAEDKYQQVHWFCVGYPTPVNVDQALPPLGFDYHTTTQVPSLRIVGGQIDACTHCIHICDSCASDCRVQTKDKHA